MSFKREGGGPCSDDREFMTVHHSDSECHISGWLCTTQYRMPYIRLVVYYPVPNAIYQVGCVLPSTECHISGWLCTTQYRMPYIRLVVYYPVPNAIYQVYCILPRQQDSDKMNLNELIRPNSKGTSAGDGLRV